MKNKKKESINVSDEEIKELVIARLRSLPSNRKISIGSDGEFTKDELVQDVRVGNRIGDKIIKIQLDYLKSFKNGIFPDE